VGSLVRKVAAWLRARSRRWRAENREFARQSRGLRAENRELRA
jgi:hypothetical protein